MGRNMESSPSQVEDNNDNNKWDILSDAPPFSAKEEIVSNNADTNHDNVEPKIIIDDEYLSAYENSRNGSHFMTKEENEEYNRLYNSDAREAVKYLREKWAEHVDRDFIQSFRCVHWMSNYEMASQIEEMLGDGKHEKEISTQAYDNSEKLKTEKRWLKSNVGLLIDGTVNLAGNSDLQTNQWHGVIVEDDDENKRRKYTSYANRLITDRDNCVSPYEFVIGDWQAKAIIADPSAITPELNELSEKYGMPIVSTDDKSLFDKKGQEDKAS